MKRYTLCAMLCLVLCIALFPACLGEEASSSEQFLSGLSQAWDGLLGMAADTGKDVSEWAEETGIADQVRDTAQDISEWADNFGLTKWAKSMWEDALSLYEESGAVEWVETASGEVRDLVEENRPAVESWFQEVGKGAAMVWDRMLHPNRPAEESPDIGH